jgi:hypothetical protein
MIAQINMRKGTSAEWAAASPVILLAGESGYDTTLKQTKLGDGSTEWADLPVVLTGDLNSGNISGETGKNYKIVACVLRNTGSGWSALNNSGHAPVGVESVTSDNESITINYSFTAAKIVSLVVTPDETFSGMGLFCGASVGDHAAVIKIFESPKIQGGFVRYTGGIWVLTGPGTSEMTTSYAGGVLTITGPSMSALTEVEPGIAQVTGRDGSPRAVVGANGVAHDVINISWLDSSDNVITTPNATHKAFFTKMSPTSQVNPSLLISGSGNLWVYGIFEV